MSRLASSIGQIQSSYTVVVVGSGYGGGIAAARLARAGQSVCVLERGKEFQPGDFPDTLAEAAKEMQVDLPEAHIGPETGLYDLRVNEDMNVVVGCGLGGTSLINASVSLAADPRVFEDERWPQRIREQAARLPHAQILGSANQTDASDNPLRQGYQRANAMLKPVPYPESCPALAKQAAHRQSADWLGETFYRTPINVTFEDSVNHVGVKQAACTLCGDCVSGCNYGAKNTLDKNYLPDAHNHGAEIYTELMVSRVARAGDRWRVYYQPVSLERAVFEAPELFVFADVVILAAGTLGSSEILLRSKQHGLSVSDQLGQRFTGNGDVLAFAYNADDAIDGVGHGDHSPTDRTPVGPCITSVIDTRKTLELNSGMVIEEGNMPGVLGNLLPAAFATAADLLGQDTDSGIFDTLAETARRAESAVRGPYHGAVQHTQTYLVMSHDDAGGAMALQDDRLRVHWEQVGRQPIFNAIEQNLIQAATALGATYIPNPTWNEWFDKRLVTVHPLGGCALGDSAEYGVVNHKHQVYADTKGSDVHKGLYVCDGSVMPRSLGVNPLLTISALAERACLYLLEDYHWPDHYSTGSQPRPPAPAVKPGIQFTETMSGFFSNQVVDDYQRGAEQGEADQSGFEFTLSIISDDLDTMLSSEGHSASMLGTVTAPALSPQPLTVTQGRFNLLVRDPDQVGVRRMRYRMLLIDENGEQWYFDGYKFIHDDRGLDIWPDTTTLYITLYAGINDQAPVYGKGILKILPAHFAKQMTTVKARHTDSKTDALQAVARFGRFFGGAVFETYGGSLAPFRAYDPDAPARRKRALNVGAAQDYDVLTQDGVSLRLTRYQGGDKGPVILSHGLGVSSRIFSLDTIDTNLLEYLYQHQYDVWLLDYRASIELPAANTQFSADDIATQDYPAAVARVLAETGAPSVQMVVHCFGSTTFFMAMLAGLQGVRSAVVSQIATHMQTPLLSRLKAGLYLPDVLDAIGVDSLTAYVDTHASWLERLYDNALRLYPVEFEERSSSPVDRRITFMYGQLWELDQLNTATHDTLHELFGVGNIRCFEHLARMVRVGHLVNYDGADVYLPHLDRLAIPMTFIHGAENSAFLPVSTETTYQLLQQTNGDLYQRHVIPDYGHIDCVFGKNAVRDVYPYILDHLEKT